MPAGPQWKEKEIWISVQSEGVGGNVQNIGSQKLNLAKFVAQFFAQQEPMIQCLEVVPFPMGGLVGDLELQVSIMHVRPNVPLTRPNLNQTQ